MFDNGYGFYKTTSSRYRLGVAVQLSVLRYPGWSLANIKEVPKRMLGYIAKQIQVRPEESTFYAQRESTHKKHLKYSKKTTIHPLRRKPITK